MSEGLTSGESTPVVGVDVATVLDILALLFAIVGLTVGGIVLLSVSFVTSLIIGIHEISLSLAVILHVGAVFISKRGT